MLADDPWGGGRWLSGLGALARNYPAQAQSAFNAVYGRVPGELAPKLGLALACELSRTDEIAGVALHHLRAH